MKQLSDFANVTAAQATFEEVAKKDAEERRAMVANELKRSAIIANHPESAVAALLDNSLIEQSTLEKEWQELERREPLRMKAVAEARAAVNRAVEQASVEVCKSELPQCYPIFKENLEFLDKIVANNRQLIQWRASLELRGFKTGSAPFCLVPNAEHIRDSYRQMIQ